MSFEKQQAEFDYLVRRAAELLDGPGRGLALDWALVNVIEQCGKLELRTGVDRQPPIHQVQSGRVGHELIIGCECYRLEHGGEVVRVVRVHNGFMSPLPGNLETPWVVAAADYRRFYRVVQRLSREMFRDKNVAPIMSATDQQRLFQNTIGFLEQGHEVLAHFGVPQKRGVLLYGSPGNGKTMACRWLMSECHRRGYLWKHVAMDHLAVAQERHTVQNLFRLSEPGIILFDDFDLGMRDRNTVGPSSLHSILLAALDGVEQKQGIIYLFTTNMQLKELDSAFLRRGRMDQVIHFQPPTAEQRRRLVLEFWHADILGALDVETVVTQTEGRSFAELDELKKLLVLQFLETDRWDWPRAWETFNASEQSPGPRRPIGFGNYRRQSLAPEWALDGGVDDIE
ncbi:MAG: ATP-binding protein [Planctomycetes bacterium]|nr:ATP-binding protein [Planctomycetota bacterium]